VDINNVITSRHRLSLRRNTLRKEEIRNMLPPSASTKDLVNFKSRVPHFSPLAIASTDRYSVTGQNYRPNQWWDTVYMSRFLAMPWIGRLAAGLLLRKASFNTKLAHVGIVADTSGT